MSHGFVSLPKHIGPYRLYYFPSIASTQTEAKKWTHEDAPTQKEDFILLTGNQTRGYGRSGSKWHAPKGSQLFFTVTKKLSKNFENLQLCSLFVANQLATCFSDLLQIESNIKWPNDILIENKKVAGILSEATQSAKNIRLHIGVGINIDVDTELEKQLEGTKPLTFLARHTQTPINAITLLARFIQGFEQSFCQISETPELIINEFTKRCALKNTLVTAELPNKVEIHGMVTGIGPSGALCIKDVGGQHHHIYDAHIKSH